MNTNIANVVEMLAAMSATDLAQALKSLPSETQDNVKKLMAKKVSYSTDPRVLAIINAMKEVAGELGIEVAKLNTIVRHELGLKKVMKGGMTIMSFLRKQAKTKGFAWSNKSKKVDLLAAMNWTEAQAIAAMNAAAA